MKLLNDATWPYLYETLNLVNTFEGNMAITNTVLFYLLPELYIDNDGNALDGYPKLAASSHELSKMYQGEFTWLDEKTSTDLKIDQFTFIRTLINIYYGEFWYMINRVLWDIPALVSILVQTLMYFDWVEVPLEYKN